MEEKRKLAEHWYSTLHFTDPTLSGPQRASTYNLFRKEKVFSNVIPLYFKY